MQNIRETVKNSPKLVGLKQVMAGIIDGTVRCVLVSYDCNGFIKAAIEETANDKNIELVFSFSMKELGKMCGIDVGASVVGLLR